MLYTAHYFIYYEFKEWRVFSNVSYSHERRRILNVELQIKTKTCVSFNAISKITKVPTAKCFINFKSKISFGFVETRMIFRPPLRRLPLFSRTVRLKLYNSSSPRFCGGYSLSVILSAYLRSYCMQSGGGEGVYCYTTPAFSFFLSSFDNLF